MRRVKKISVCLACLLLLCGCAARELEDRRFAEAIELDLREGELWGGFGGRLVSGESVKEICRAYQESMDQYLDLGHIKAIVLGERLTQDEEKMRAVLLELEQMPVISRSSLVFTHRYEGDESYLEMLEKEGKTPGEYLLDRYQNNPYRTKDETVSLGDLLD